jgi:lipopolysaccharide export system permease protein
MAWTLYRYILWDLLKLLVISASVLVTVISFAAAIKPLSDGLLSAGSLLKFVGYTAPTMLAFVLPFAGAFASTLVFLRLAGDNEVTAMSASGLSYASILAPVFVLGIALTMGLLYLSNFVIPTFYRAAAQTLERDLLSVLVTRLNQNQPYSFGGYVVFADQAVQRDLTPQERVLFGDNPPSNLVQLGGVAVGRLEESGRLRHEAAATVANVLVFRGPEDSSVMLGLANAMRTDDRGGLGWVESAFYGPFELPTPMRDRTEFFSWRQLRELRDAPERYGDIRRAREHLADTLAVEMLRLLLLDHLGERGTDPQAMLLGVRGDQTHVISAPRARRAGQDILLQATQRFPVVFESRTAGQSPRRFEAQSATLRLERTPGAEQPSVLPTLREVRVLYGDDQQPTTEQAELRLDRMVWPTPVVDDEVDRLNAVELVDFARDQRFADSTAVAAADRHLTEQILRVAYRITGQKHERVASAIACLLVLLLGALLSMRYRNQMSLVVYFWAFALAIITVIVINTGNNLARDLRYPLYAGLGLMWSANVILAVIAAALYCRVARN